MPSPKRTNTALPFIAEVNRRVKRCASPAGCATHNTQLSTPAGLVGVSNFDPTETLTEFLDATLAKASLVHGNRRLFANPMLWTVAALLADIVRRIRPDGWPSTRPFPRWASPTTPQTKVSNEIRVPRPFDGQDLSKQQIKQAVFFASTWVSGGAGISVLAVRRSMDAGHDLLGSEPLSQLQSRVVSPLYI
jgi:hypothetical protein